MKTVGIIGGMGPQATVDLFQKIIRSTPAEKDQDHVHVLIDSYAQIPDRTAFLMGQGETPLPFLLEAASRLEAAGVDALCMPCNTAHYFAEEIRQKVSVPLISIIDSTLKEIRTACPSCKKVGLMATRGTMIGGMYHNVFAGAGLEILDVPDAVQGQVMDVIYGVKAGHLMEKASLFQECIAQYHAMGAEILVAGCTELPMLVPYVETDLAIIDPTLALAKEVVRYAFENK